MVLLHDYFNGHDFAREGTQFVLPMEIVTLENVPKYKKALVDEHLSKEHLKSIDFGTYSKARNPDLEAYRFDFE